MAIDLKPLALLEFLQTRPRYEASSANERVLIEHIEEALWPIFSNYSYLPVSVGLLELPTLALKPSYPARCFTVFDCLFTADLSYV